MALHRQTTLSKQTSQMFQMTIDEFQNSLGGSGKLGSLNLVRSRMHDAFTVPTARQLSTWAPIPSFCIATIQPSAGL